MLWGRATERKMNTHALAFGSHQMVMKEKLETLE